MAFKRVRHLALSSTSYVAATMDEPVYFLMLFVHAVVGGGGGAYLDGLQPFLSKCPQDPPVSCIYAQSVSTY